MYEVRVKLNKKTILNRAVWFVRFRVFLGYPDVPLLDMNGICFLGILILG